MSRPSSPLIVFSALVVVALAAAGVTGLRPAEAPPSPARGAHGRHPMPPPPPPVWPAVGAPLFDVAAELPPSWTGMKVVVDAGHGALGNDGNTSVRCEEEQDFTRRAADALAERLVAAGGLEVRRTRPDSKLVSYNARIALAEGWPADAVISLHSDARESQAVELDPLGCTGNRGSHGFSVLYSDEGDAALVGARRALAEAVAARLVEAGFPAYAWDGYADLYDGDPTHPGVFVDRHVPRKRIKMLRVPKVPLVIVETHQALDAEEVLRWDEPRTNDAFAAAIRAALLDLRGR